MNNNSGKLARLQKYLEFLNQRLGGAIPPKHSHRPDIFKEMIRVDMVKTQQDINKLK